MELVSVEFDSITWKNVHLGENVILLEAPTNISIKVIHRTTTLLQKILKKDLVDIVPSYNSIALFTDQASDEIITKLQSTQSIKPKSAQSPNHETIPICYELGLDLQEVAEYAKMDSEEVIRRHLEGRYQAILIGFTPGFIYIDGLDPSLECPRKTSPRVRLDSGSVGIGGSQTGIYSLASPGGWNIIGRTPMNIFDADRKPPMNIVPGTKITYQRITKEEFQSWES